MKYKLKLGFNRLIVKFLTLKNFKELFKKLKKNLIGSIVPKVIAVAVLVFIKLSSFLLILSKSSNIKG
jgi:hypothetical protein